MKDYKYDVAISFAGEYRYYVIELVKKLEQCGLKVFYDNWNIDEIWGKDLKSYLSSIYVKEALYTISIFSREYFEKVWTKFEFKNIMLRQNSENEYLLPIIMDDIKIPEKLSNLGFINSKNFSIDEIALMVRDKVKIRKEKNIYSIKESIEKKKMTILDKEGKAETVEVIVAFEFKDDKKEYVVYTKNEKDEHGNTKVYVSYVDRSSEEPVLFGVEENDWEKVKEVLRELAADKDGNTSSSHPPFFDMEGNEII